MTNYRLQLWTIGQYECPIIHVLNDKWEMLYKIPGPVEVQHNGGSSVKITIPTGEQFELVTESELSAQVFASYGERLLRRYRSLRYGNPSAMLECYSSDTI